MRPTTLLFALLALAAAPFAASAEGDGDMGSQLYQLCAQCHGPEGAGDAIALAPAIAGMPEWYVKAQLVKFHSGARGTHPDDVAGMRMRPMSLSLRDETQIADVAAYVAGLPPVPPEPTLVGGDAVRGKTLYAPCTACHGPDGTGIEQLNGAPLRGVNDWYLLRQMHNFRTGIRGTNPKDTSGALMRPMSMTLPDEQAILDVIAYITTLDGSGSH
jgi:cytochrome c553